MSFANATGQTLDGFMIQLNKNTFGLAPASQNIPLPGPIAPGSTVNALVPLTQNPTMASGAVSPVLQVSLAVCGNAVRYVQCVCEPETADTRDHTWIDCTERDRYFFIISIFHGGCVNT